MNSWSWVGIVCAILSLVLSISIIIYLCCSGECYGIENISFGDASVAALGTIVGLLIGWNIYRTIDAEVKLKTMDERYNKIIEEKMQKMQVYNDASAEFIQGILVLSNSNTNNYALAYERFVLALFHFIESDMVNDKTIESCICNMEESLKKTKCNINLNNGKIEEKINVIIKKGRLGKELVCKICELEQKRKGAGNGGKTHSAAPVTSAKKADSAGQGEGAAR